MLNGHNGKSPETGPATQHNIITEKARLQQTLTAFDRRRLLLGRAMRPLFPAGERGFESIRFPPIAVINAATHSRKMTEPISYGPDKVLVAFWALVGSPPAVIWAWVFFRSPSSETALPLLLALFVPLAPVLFASRFRVTFASTMFEYRRWGPTVRVAYSNIARIEVTNVTPIAQQPVGAFVVTKNNERLPFWPKLFPKEAVRRFFALAA